MGALRVGHGPHPSVPITITAPWSRLELSWPVGEHRGRPSEPRVILIVSINRPVLFFLPGLRSLLALSLGSVAEVLILVGGFRLGVPAGALIVFPVGGVLFGGRGR